MEANSIKLAIIGSRGITKRSSLLNAIRTWLNITRIKWPEIKCIISGGATGVDQLAETIARERNIPCIVFRPDYERYGRRAPHIRNDAIIAECTHLIAIWDGNSRGTASMIEKIKTQNKPHAVFKNPTESGFEEASIAY